MNRSAAAEVPTGPISSRRQEVQSPGGAVLRCPASRQLRERLRAMAADLVAGWQSGGVPADVRSAAGLRARAEALVRRGGAEPAHVGWTMVAIVSEYWRRRLSAAPQGRRLLLLPDCPVAAADRHDSAGERSDVPHVCGPACGIATIWAAARDSGWVVEPVSRALGAIGSLLTGQYDGVLGVARLRDLEKAFGMLPAFSLPIAAVPFDARSADVPAGVPAAAKVDRLSEGGGPAGRCAAALDAAAIDVDWVLGLLGVAGGSATPMGDYLPLLREAAELCSQPGLEAVAAELGLNGLLGGPRREDGGFVPLDAAAAMGSEFLTRGGKFLRPFICLAAHDAVRLDRGAAAQETRAAAKAAALAIEIFHKASLVHDDIEDADVRRYGRPTLHVERGVPSAINAGDYLLGAGYRIVAALPGVDATAIRDVLGILADAHVRLARGQGAELWWRDGCTKGLTPDEALAIYGLKTSPAFEAAVAMGIRLAGLAPAEAGAIGEYALHVGTGFQVLNDLKDWSGDLENDRRAAGDLLGGRPTVMWALALERLPDAGVRRLRELAESAGRPGVTEAEAAAAVAAARELCGRAGIVREAAAIAARERRLAAAAAATCRLPRLREILEFLLELAVPEPAADDSDC